MKDISFLYKVLNQAQLDAMEEVFVKREQTLESFKLMRKKYAGIKNRIKAIEKKLLVIMEQEKDDAWVSHWIMREVASIENKYKDIELGIKRYNQTMNFFNDTINSRQFWGFKPEEVVTHFQHSPVNQLKSYLGSADSHIGQALNAMRITERYFKNISSFFKSHADMLALKKQRAERERLNEMKAQISKTENK